ncbi:MAG: FAD:protein FMN transferase, partial [Asticcacaulis sp.]
AKVLMPSDTIPIRTGENLVLVPDLDAPPALGRGAFVRLSGPTMGVTWRAQFYDPEGIDPALWQARLQATVDRICQAMSAWIPDSAINQFNKAPAGALHTLPEDMVRVVARALEIATLTEGAFDPGLGQAVRAWGFGAGPVDPTVQTASGLGSTQAWRTLDFEPLAGTLRQPGGLHLDLNGIAKGYGVDALLETLTRAGVVSALVEIGGELKSTGIRDDGTPWWVEIEPPGAGEGSGKGIGQTKRQAVPGGRMLVALCDLAIATSGDYRRFRLIDGRRISHTIDPRTGQPVHNVPAQVCVLHPDAMSADALATAFGVMPPDAALALADHLGLMVCWRHRTREGLRLVTSAAFRKRLAV